MGRVGRAIKGESDDERKAREWEEARERQNEKDRKERNAAKALTAAEEARRRQAEYEDEQRRRAAAERLERDRRAREAEAQRLRDEEAKRKEDIKRKHDLELRKKENQERERIRREVEAKRKADEAERARIKAAQDAEKARLKAIEDAEKARLKAIEDAKRAIEKAKQDYVQAVADGHAAVEQEDRDHIDRMQKEMQARARFANQQLKHSMSQDDQQHSSDSGVSIPSTGHEQASPKQHQQQQQSTASHGSILKNGNDVGFTQSPSNSRPSTAASVNDNSSKSPLGGDQRPAMQRRAMTDVDGSAVPSAALSPPIPPAALRSMSQDAPNGPPQPPRLALDPQQPQPTSNVRFAGSPEQKGTLLPPMQLSKKGSNLPSLRFASALTVGARGPPSARSPLTLAPAVRSPWDAMSSSNSSPTALAELAFQISIADTSDPRKPVTGQGWQSHGLGDPDLIKSHYHVLKIDNVRLVKRKVGDRADADDDRTDASKSSHGDDRSSVGSSIAGSTTEYEEIWEEYTHEVLVFDLFEQVFTRTTPDVLSRIVSHLDCADLKALRQSCKEVRFALDHLEGRELILRRFLNQVGYRTWKFMPRVAASSKSSTSTPTNPPAASTPQTSPPATQETTQEKDPLPLTFGDVEAFLLSPELSLEYSQVANDWLRVPHEMDARIPRLARASTRAYSRVLSRLRAQPVFKVPVAAVAAIPPAASPSPLGTPRCTTPNKHMSSSLTVEQARSRALELLGGTRSGSLSPSSPGTPAMNSHQSTFLLSPALNSPQISSINQMGSVMHASPSSSSHQVATIPSPWRPGRAAMFRVWVPCRDGMWLSDEEIARCERELFLAGVWSFLKRGDIVWNVAMGERGNSGKLIFDGRYLRDLSFAFDRIGHLPSWLNLFLYPPGYYHNIIRTSTNSPVIYLDILPWREQIVSSLRLVQDQVESVSAAGARYRIAKWLYRSVAHVQAGQIVSDVGLQCCDENWAGKIVFETEGTSEHAKDFLARCAGPTATPQVKAKLLAMVLGNAGANQTASGMSVLKNPAVQDPQGRRIQAHTPFAVLRERSRPGLIWLRPVMERERLQ